MTTLKEGRHTGEHVLSEANGGRSRETGFLASGKLEAGSPVAYDADANYVPVKFDATDGTEKPVAVLYGAADATDGPVKCVVHARACELIGEALAWPEGATDAQKTTGEAALVERGIILRD